MADNSRSQSPAQKAADAALLGIAIALMLFSAAIPFYLIYVIFASRRRVAEILRDGRSRRKFWLDEAEIHRFKILHQKYFEAKAAKEQADLAGEREGITRNQDGQFSRRSNRGKEIRDTIDVSEQVLENSAREITELRSRPFKAWKEVDQWFRKKGSSVRGMIAFLILLPICYMEFGPKADFPQDQVLFYIFWWCVAAVGAGLFYAFQLAIIPSTIRRFFDKPPEVSLENVSSWSADADRNSTTGNSNKFNHSDGSLTAFVPDIKGPKYGVGLILKICGIGWIILIILVGISIGFEKFEAEGLASGITEGVLVVLIFSVPGLILYWIGRILTRKKAGV